MVCTAKLAEVNIGIDFNYKENAFRYSPYFTTDTAQCLLTISQERMSTEKETLQALYPKRSFTYTDAEYNVLYQDIPPILFQNGVVTFHGVLIEMNNDGYLFTADSGVGKSTHANLWERYFCGKATIINGDKPLLRICDDGLYGYGSPWMGKENIGINKRVKIKAICFIYRNDNNIIRQIEKDSYVIGSLMQQTMIMDKGQILLKLFRWYKKCANFVNFYQLGCNTNIDAAVVAYNGMNS
jgi:hypothetical protein